VVGGQTLKWKKGDTFCVPAWNEYVHHADNVETVYLYNAHDKPMLRALGFYRTATDDVEALVS
jgi:gentisate 1,2-dioxygenase